MLSAKEIVDGRRKRVSKRCSLVSKNFEPSGALLEVDEVHSSLSEIKKMISSERIKKFGSLSEAVWQPELKLAEIVKQIGPQWNKIGQRLNKKLYIHPEEALYMLENGSLQIYYNEVPLSIQRAYFILLGPGTGVSIEMYRVYSYLNVAGYKVVRHAQKSQIIKSEQCDVHKDIKCTKIRSNSAEFYTSEPCKKFKTAETKSAFKCNENYDAKETLTNLKFIHPVLDQAYSEVNVDYDIYLPIKKQSSQKNVKLPDYRIIVHRGYDTMPDLKKMAGLIRHFKDNTPVVNAIVFPDHIAFYLIQSIITPNVFDIQ